MRSIRIDNACALCYNEHIKSEVIPMHSKCRFCSNDRAFSLIELIVVIAIMAILAAVAIPTFAYFITQAKEASDIAFMNDLEHAIMLAATADMKTGEISELKVEINKNNGSIIKITYFDKHHLDYDELPDEDTERGEGYSFEKGDGQTISQIIDWDYKFKAHNSVKDNKHWKDDRWTLSFSETPEMPESVFFPDTPLNPSAPSISDPTDSLAQPDIPEDPDSPREPDDPDDPDSPALPDLPEVPGSPWDPNDPFAPDPE